MPVAFVIGFAVGVALYHACKEESGHGFFAD